MFSERQVGGGGIWNFQLNFLLTRHANEITLPKFYCEIIEVNSFGMGECVLMKSLRRLDPQNFVSEAHRKLLKFQKLLFPFIISAEFSSLEGDDAILSLITPNWMRQIFNSSFEYFISRWNEQKKEFPVAPADADCQWRFKRYLVLWFLFKWWILRMLRNVQFLMEIFDRLIYFFLYRLFFRTKSNDDSFRSKYMFKNRSHTINYLHPNDLVTIWMSKKYEKSL